MDPLDWDRLIKSKWIIAPNLKVSLRILNLSRTIYNKKKKITLEMVKAGDH